MRTETEELKRLLDFKSIENELLISENENLKANVNRLKAQRAKLIESAEELFRFVGAELYGPIEHFEAAWEAAKNENPNA